MSFRLQKSKFYFIIFFSTYSLIINENNFSLKIELINVVKNSISSYTCEVVRSCGKSGATKTHAVRIESGMGR